MKKVNFFKQMGKKSSLALSPLRKNIQKNLLHHPPLTEFWILRIKRQKLYREWDSLFQRTKHEF